MKDASRLFLLSSCVFAAACVSDPEVPGPEDGGPGDSGSGLDSGRPDSTIPEAGLDGSSADANLPADSSTPNADANSPVDAGEGGSEAGCAEGAKQCSFNGVQTCAAGSWGSAAPCPSSTPQCNAGVCGQPLSCQTSLNGTANCGPGGSGSESCCTSFDVDGGTYNRTYTNAGTGPTAEADPASVSDFRLDKYLVTVGRFRQFASVALEPDGGPGWVPAEGSGKHTHLNGGAGLAGLGADGGPAYEPGWVVSDDQYLAPTTANLTTGCDNPASATWTASPGTQESLPINCVTWWDAYAFCIWDGGFLPSESEWEYAAAGGSLLLEYPWGATAPGTSNGYAIYGDYPTCYYPQTGNCAGVVNIPAVGTPKLGAGTWGQLDLAGELFEWNLDWTGTYFDPCDDCAQFNPAASKQRVKRGGAFDLAPSYMLPSARWSYDPGFYAPTGSYEDGFRCARSP